jgi:Xaa-Pro dipeptidase
MDIQSRRQAIREDMKARGIDILLGFHDGTHFGGSPDPLRVLTGFRCLDAAAILLHAKEQSSIVVTPRWDAGRASEYAPDMQVAGADDLVQGVSERLKRYRVDPSRVGVAGLANLPRSQVRQVSELLGGKPRKADGVIFEHARAKSAEDIESARAATRIAEQGYERMLELVRPGLREDELAVELRWTMKSLGAEDNFFMFTSGPPETNRAVHPCSSRVLERGDFVLTELSPIYKGQMTQICRTVVVGEATPEQRQAYGLLVRAYENGLKAARPGVPMSDVCKAVDKVIEAAGYGEYANPPWLRLRRRGHGLGFGSTSPGDVGPENTLALEPGMVFVLHPNQYLPQTGYLMCGEPVLITEKGAEQLSKKRATLAEISP